MASPDLPDDRRAAIDALERSTRAFLDLIDGVPDAAWLARPAGEEWSIAETVEHVVLADRAILAALGRLLAAPSEWDDGRVDDAAITAAMFAGAGPAPGIAPPLGRYATRAEGVAALRAAADAIVAWASGRREDLRARCRPHRVFGTFDGVQWLLFAAAHQDSHAAQVRGLRAHRELAA